MIEEGIRIAATLCDNLIHEGVSCGLVSNARDIITGETIDIASGQSGQHIQQIQEQLGRLDLTRKPEAFAPLLLQHGFSTYRDPVLLLISLNCSDGICRAWSDCLGASMTDCGSCRAMPIARTACRTPSTPHSAGR